MSRRKGEQPVVHEPLLWSERCTIRRMIQTGDRWLYAWIFQQCVGVYLLSRKTKIPTERINEIFYGADPTEAELEAMAEPFRTDAASLRASMAYERSLTDSRP